jgi:hypothetical protein
MPGFPVTQRSRIRRRHARGSPDAAAVHAVLDAAPLCHAGYGIDGEPYVTPTINWREGHPVRAGVVPMPTMPGAAQPAPGPHPDLPLPADPASLIASGWLR